MRVLHIVEPFSSGITTFIIGITTALPHHEHIVLHGNRATADEIDQVRARFHKKVSFIKWKKARREINPYYDINALIQLITVIRSEHFDVIHLHSAKAGFLGRLACRLLNIDNLLYTPNSAPFARTDIGKTKRMFFKYLEILGSKWCGQVVACGLSEHQLYHEAGIEAKYINNGLPKKELTAATDLNDKKIVIGFVGIANAQKAPTLFNKIASNFVKDDNIIFKWIGDGPLRSEINSPNIEVTGWLKTSQSVQNELSTIDIFLSTSQWEGQPFAVIEAMRDKKCLLLFNCVGNKDLVVHGVNGFLFHNEEVAIRYIYKLVRDRSLIRKMGNKSRDLFLENHDILVSARQYELEYERLAKR